MKKHAKCLKIRKGKFKMSIETKLHIEIDDEFEALAGLDVGSEQHKVTVDGLTKLLDRAIELEKLDIEHEDREKAQEKEHNLKLAQMEEEKKDRLIRNCLTAAGIIIPTIVTIWGTVKSMEFEKDGTITTIMGRGFVQKLLPKK
jgi:hypothetical protein